MLGTPPPAHLPRASDAEKREEAEKQKKEEEDKSAAQAKANDERVAMEMDLLSLTSPAIPEPGVSASAARW